MPTALVTGSPEHAHTTALILKAAGFEVSAAEPDGAEIPANLQQLDCYVQLPPEPPFTGDDTVAPAHSAVTHALTMRFDATARVAPRLAARARVVLVADPTDGTPTFDMHLVRPLVEAIIADHGVRGVRVVAINGLRSPEEIIAATRTEPPVWSGYQRVEPDLPFCDWRNEIICQSSLDFST